MRRPRRKGEVAASPAPDIRDLAVGGLGAQGDGLAADGTAGPVFVPGTLPGERVRAGVVGDRGELIEVLTASADRVAPPCPHFGDCGGCALQHWRAEPYLAWKAEQIRLALGRERIETEILPPFAAPPGSRRRLALHARQVGGRTLVGFKGRRSWRLAPIEVCPVADPRLVAAFPAFRRLAAPLFEHPSSAPTLHVTLTDSGIDVDITGVERRTGALSADARMQVAEAAAEADFARVTLGGEMVYLARAPTIQVGRATVALPAGGFLQAVPEAEAAMAAFVWDALSGAKQVADLYCGVGAFALRLAEDAAVAAFDVSAPAIAALNTARGSAPGLKPIAAEARDLVRRPVLVAELKRTDGAVIDPPRAGAAEQHRELARSGVGRVAGVSCNPATFARDARILTDGGFTLIRVLPVDQFLWSPHVELVGVFERERRLSEAEARPGRRRAFAPDTRAYAARAAAKALWWGAAGVAARALARPTDAKPTQFETTAEAPPAGFVRRAWLSAFEKEAADVAAGLYPAMDDRPADPLAAIRRTADFITDALAVEARRRRGDGAEVRAEAPPTYPAYYRQNFHFQSGGWFTAESAGRYEAQVEALFAGTAGAMRRRALSLLAKAWRNRDHRGLTVLDLACGAGGFLHDLGSAFPRARLIGLDLSPAYLGQARTAAPDAALIQAKAEQLPFADASLDALTSVYLFHELPPKVRTAVAAEIARVLKPGGVFAFADSIQPADEPRLGRLLDAFPAYFHEPYYAGYAQTDLAELFGAAGLRLLEQDSAFLTKAVIFERV